MPANGFGIPAKLFAVGALLFALTACGTNGPVVCNAPNSTGATCTCGSGTAACPISPGPEFLYAISITSTGGTGGIGARILAFSIDRNSGALTPIGSVPGPSTFVTVGLAAVNNQFLFSSDRYQSQLDGFSIDQTTGALSPIAGSPFSTGALSFPTGLASPPGGNFLYVSDIGSVGAFAISSTGVPSAVPGSPFLSGSGLLATAPSGGLLYTAGPPGGVAAFTIGSTGALTQVPGSPFTIPGQADNVPTGIVDTGSYVYTTLPLTNQIAAFSIVSGTGALTPVPGSPFSSGTNPSTLVFAKGFLFALNQPLRPNGSISGYSVNSNGGVLTPLSGSPFAISGVSMVTDSFGDYLYIAGLDGIEAFAINSTSGALAPVSGSPHPGVGSVILTLVQIPPP